MTPHPQRKDAGASSFVVCFEGKIQSAHKTGSSAPHRPSGLSLSHTPRPQVTTARGLEAPLQARPAPKRRLPPLELAVCSGRPKGTTRAKATAPVARRGGKLGTPCWARHWSPGIQLSWLSRPGHTAQGAAPSPGGPTSPVFWPAEPRPPREEQGFTPTAPPCEKLRPAMGGRLSARGTTISRA